MKIKLIVIIVIISTVLLFTQHSTAYSGKYYAGSSNEELVLNANNSFNLNITNYRGSLTISGKYSISNNRINLQTNDSTQMLFINAILSGNVAGSVITFPKSQYGSATIFKKSWRNYPLMAALMLVLMLCIMNMLVDMILTLVLAAQLSHDWMPRVHKISLS